MVIGLVVFGGLVGGFANALISDNGFPLPRTETTAKGERILRPGFLGNLFFGALAALVTWGLYGPIANVELYTSGTQATALSLTVASFVGAIVSGAGGARVISGEIDKRLLQAAASEAAGRQGNPDAAARIGSASPAVALETAKNM
jgi:hypothetical protein